MPKEDYVVWHGVMFPKNIASRVAIYSFLPRPTKDTDSQEEKWIWVGTPDHLLSNPNNQQEGDTR